jgi:4-hydroxy-tetrahydrodipicolinate reductase
MIKVGIVGSTGRVGTLLIENIAQDKELTLSALHVFDELKQDTPKGILVTNSMKELLKHLMSL